jgi:hypothetical protein
MTEKNQATVTGRDTIDRGGMMSRRPGQTLSVAHLAEPPALSTGRGMNFDELEAMAAPHLRAG